jgi:hypothetical protein
MREMPSSVDRLETRLDCLAARVDALYSLLEARGIVPSPDGEVRDSLFDELLQIEEAPFARERRAPRTRRRTAGRLHVGSASGV